MEDRVVNTGKDKEKTAMEKQGKITKSNGDPLARRSISNSQKSEAKAPKRSIFHKKDQKTQ